MNKQQALPINSPEAIAQALAGKTIAVVGLSSNPQSPSYEVAAYLQGQGYHIIPVNPKEQEVLGERAMFFIGVFLPAERRIRRRAGAPHFVALADTVSVIAQPERIRRDRIIPHRAVKARASVAVEKQPPRRQPHPRRAARRALPESVF